MLVQRNQNCWLPIFDNVKNLCFIFFLFVLGFNGNSQTKEIVLVIDAGHGGSDPGHLPTDSSTMQEKELNLIIAKYLGSYIDKYLQNVKIIYTRSDDNFVSLDDRVTTANTKNADYFISIHCNGYENTAIKGTESHVHTLGASKSSQLAKRIEHQFSTRAGRHSRGVKDKNDLGHSLQVLKYTKMTSVLVECGYITNDSEADFLNTSYGQEIIASAIFRAFRSQIQSDHPSIDFVQKTPTNTSASNDDKKYWVQIMSSKTEVDTNHSCFKNYQGTVIRKKLDTTSEYKYIYLVEGNSNKEEVQKILPTVRDSGFSDAYIVYR